MEALVCDDFEIQESRDRFSPERRLFHAQSSAGIEHDQMMRKLVGIVAAGREVLGK